LFVYFERERERTHEWGEREKERKRERSRLPTQQGDPHRTGSHGP